MCKGTCFTFGVPLVYGIAEDVPAEIYLGKATGSFDLSREDYAVTDAELHCMDQLMADCIGKFYQVITMVRCTKHKLTPVGHVSHELGVFLAFCRVNSNLDTKTLWMKSVALDLDVRIID